jgi:heme/copper-type cytochrome/quinol oxidase subunit 2
MRARVIALPVDQYQAWVENQRKNILAAQAALAQQRREGFGSTSNPEK